jgi:hypothetical protein
VFYHLSIFITGHSERLDINDMNEMFFCAANAAINAIPHTVYLGIRSIYCVSKYLGRLINGIRERGGAYLSVQPTYRPYRSPLDDIAPTPEHVLRVILPRPDIHSSLEALAQRQPRMRGALVARPVRMQVDPE